MHSESCICSSKQQQWGSHTMANDGKQNINSDCSSLKEVKQSTGFDNVHSGNDVNDGNNVNEIDDGKEVKEV